MSRRRGPSLLRTAARTAAIAGTATATSRAVHSTMDQKALKAQQAQIAAVQSQQEIEQIKAQLAAAQSPPAAQPDLLEQLTRLAQLKEAGALTDEEFQLAKAKLLS